MNESVRPLALGSLIEGYRIEAVLGQGSFGITYLVEDTDLGLRFALKEYLPVDIAGRSNGGRVRPRTPESQSAFERGMQRFLREGRTLAALDHPGIVKVLRYFESLGTAYLLMTYYEGQPLHSLLASGGVFDAEEVGALAGPMLDSLEYLHDHGVTHGDIKPANIYVTRDGRPILLDFGAARVASAQDDERIIMGSEGYAAIEQMTPDGDMGPWTDIHGMAATLYRLLTGETPLSARHRQDALSSGQPDPLTSLQSRLGRDFAPEFTSAVMSGLQLSPAARPQSVADWRKALEGARVPGRAAPSEPVHDDEREWLPRILAGVVILVLVAMLVYLFTGQDPQAPDESAEPADGGAQQAPAEVPSLAEDESSWEQAVRADTAPAYRAYLQAFPNGKRVEDARAQLAILDSERWQAVSATDTRSAYEDYLAEFPEGQYRIEAEAKVEAFQQAQRADDEAWERARNLNTVEALNDYINNHPGGAHLAEARAQINQIERAAQDEQAWAATQKVHTRAAYQSYLDAFPQGRHVAEALAAIDDLTLRPGKVFRDCADCPEMVVVPPGSFLQGSDDGAPGARSNEKPQRQVRLAQPFAISVHEITFEDWDRCVAAGDCRAQPVDNGWGRGRRPVIMASFDDAQSYVTWLSKKTSQQYDLPSESQWEYAARAGETGAWAGGDPGSVCEHGNIAGTETGFDWRHSGCGDSFSLGTAETGTFRANNFGIHDMVGNVAEWTRDCMNLSYLDAPSDGSAWERGMCASRMTRGGSWFSGSTEIRLPARFNLKAGERNDFTGIRIVRRVLE